MRRKKSDDKRKPRTRRSVLLMGVLVMLSFCVFLSIYKPEEEATPTLTPIPPTATPLPPTPIPPAPTATLVPTAATPTLAPNVYHVVNVDDVSVALAVRFSVEVTTEFPISAGQISDLCEQVVEDLKSQRPFNAIVVFLYDTRSVLSAGYSIAKCEYSPNGVWGNSGNVQTGDYSTHKFTYEYQPKVNDPQAALLDRPTEQEYNLCQQWEKLADELLSALPLESTGDDLEATETIAFERIAESNGVSVQIVEDAVWKCTFWIFR